MISPVPPVKQSRIATKRGSATTHTEHKWQAVVVGGTVCAILLVSAMLALGGRPMAVAQVPCPPTPTPSPSPTPAPTPNGPPGGPYGAGQICYPPGWSLVGGAEAFPVPLWIWDPAAAQYHELPAGSQFPSGPNENALESNGQGAWAFFPQTTAVPISVYPSGLQVSVAVLGPGRWQQIGNPLNQFQAIVCGSGLYVFSYDSATGTYSPATTLTYGQGAWVYAPAGGGAGSTITLKPTDQSC